MSKKLRFLELAKELSDKSDHHTHKIGCVIARGNKILGTGFNIMKTHPKSPHAYRSVHAEFMAAMNANCDVEGATAYIFRQQKSGKWAIAKPCSSCWKFLMELGVTEVVYSFEGTYRVEELG